MFWGHISEEHCFKELGLRFVYAIRDLGFLYFKKKGVGAYVGPKATKNGIPALNYRIYFSQIPEEEFNHVNRQSVVVTLLKYRSEEEAMEWFNSYWDIERPRISERKKREPLADYDEENHGDRDEQQEAAVCQWVSGVWETAIRVPFSACDGDSIRALTLRDQIRDRIFEYYRGLSEDG